LRRPIEYKFVMDIRGPETQSTGSDVLTAPVTGRVASTPATGRMKGAKALLALSSVIVALVAIELLFRVFALSLPLSLAPFLQEDVKILSQSSKRETIPHDYIAILGDSYAAGVGDWYHEAVRQNPFGNPPFQSTHVIHDVTGRDVVSLGTPGGASFDGYVYRPLTRLNMLRSRGYAIEDPATVIVYVYEGNDFRDNMRFLGRYWREADAFTAANMVALFERLISGETPQDEGLLASIKQADLTTRLYIAKIPWVAYRSIGAAEEASTTIGDADERVDLRVGGRHIRPPTRLMAPPMMYNDELLDRTLLVFQESLRYVMRRFGAAKFLTVYIPSPLVSYELDGPSVKIGRPDGAGRRYAMSELLGRSDDLCNRVLAVAGNVGSEFLDLRPRVRREAREHAVHGPGDWGHFNRIGYETMGRTIAERLEHPGESSACAALGR